MCWIVLTYPPVAYRRKLQKNTRQYKKLTTPHKAFSIYFLIIGFQKVPKSEKKDQPICRQYVLFISRKAVTGGASGENFCPLRMNRVLL
jgi:hypothetical protein